jgi:hypothetical protein
MSEAIIHVNQNVIRSNLKQNKRDPPIVCRARSRNIKPQYGHEADLYFGKIKVGSFVYSPDKPLDCGARLYFKTDVLSVVPHRWEDNKKESKMVMLGSFEEDVELPATIGEQYLMRSQIEMMAKIEEQGTQINKLVEQLKSFTMINNTPTNPENLPQLRIEPTPGRIVTLPLKRTLPSYMTPRDAITIFQNWAVANSIAASEDLFWKELYYLVTDNTGINVRRHHTYLLECLRASGVSASRIKTIAPSHVSALEKMEMLPEVYEMMWDHFAAGKLFKSRALVPLGSGTLNLRVQGKPENPVIQLGAVLTETELVRFERLASKPKKYDAETRRKYFRPSGVKGASKPKRDTKVKEVERKADLALENLEKSRALGVTTSKVDGTTAKKAREELEVLATSNSLQAAKPIEVNPWVKQVTRQNKNDLAAM